MANMESLIIYCWESVRFWCVRFGSASRISATFFLAAATSFWRAGFAIAASTASTSECSRLAPFFLSVDQRVALCTNATSSAPADCARQVHAAAPRGGRLAHHLVLELCAGVVSSIPANCVARLSRVAAKALSQELQVELCKNAHSDVSPNPLQHTYPHLIRPPSTGARGYLSDRKYTTVLLAPVRLARQCMLADNIDFARCKLAELPYLPLALGVASAQM